MKYASSIKVLDAYLVASEQRASKFYEGISYFISVWQRWTCQPNAKLSVEVYTVGNKQTPNGFLTGRDATGRLNQHILEPLERALPCVASGFVKDDYNPPPIFHARLIHVKMRAYVIDPGFDGFGLDGPIRRCFFRLESAGERHVADCVKLRNAV